jgi:hypothetical protein
MLIVAALTVFAQRAAAQDAGGISMPPPPPEDRPAAPPDTVTTASAVTAPVQVPPPPPVTPPAVASVTPATLPRATPLRAGSRASRTLARLDAILTDEGESDALQRRAFGTALLVGGALSAATAVIPFVLPSSSTSASFSIAIASTSLTIGGLLAITGAVQMFQRGPWEQLAHELHEDPVTDPSARLAAALLRWERRIELERSGQRLTGGTVIALGAVSAGVGVYSIASNGALSGGGAGLAVGLPMLTLACAYVPLGVVILGQRTPSERALRVFRLSQGERLASRGAVAPRVEGVSASLNGAVIYGSF